MTTPYYDSEDTRVQETGDPNPSNANLAAPMGRGTLPRPAAAAGPNLAPALKRVLFALIGNASMTTEVKQELHDLLLVHFGTHDDDVTRPGTIGTNRSGSVRAEDAVPDPRDAMIANLQRELASERAKNADNA